METQELVVEGLRHEIQDPDLLLNGESSGTVVDLLTGNSCLLQKRIRLEPRASRARPGEPRDAPGRSRQRAESCGIDSIHGHHTLLVGACWPAVTILWHATARRHVTSHV